MNNVINASGYCRISTDKQREGTSIGEQKRIIHEHCKRNGIELGMIYVDEGVSGATDHNDRPALSKLINDAKMGKFSLLVFTKLDRLARSNRKILNILHLLKEMNVSINCVSEPSIGADSLTGDILVNILGLTAQIERRMILDRTRSGRIARYREGKITQNVCPYGFRWDDKSKLIKVNKKQKEIHRKIVSMYLDQGYSVKGIAIQLTKRRVSTPSMDKKRKNRVSTKWNATSIRKILFSDHYHTGVFYMMRHGRNKGKEGKTHQAYNERDKSEWIPIELSERFLTDLEWDRIQRRRELMKMRIKKRHKNLVGKFLLENVPFKCGVCGGKIHKRIKREKNGKVRTYYVCYWHNTTKTELIIAGKERCDLVALNSDEVDRQVMNQLAWTLANPIKYHKEWLATMDYNKSENRILELKDLCAKLERKIDQAYDVLGELSTDDARDRFIAKLKQDENLLAEYKSEMNKLRLQIQSLTSNNDILKSFKGKKNVMQTRQALLSFIKKQSFEDRQRIVESIVNDETGQILLDWFYASDILSTAEMENERIDPSTPLKDRKPTARLSFLLDMRRVSAVIESLNPDEFLRERYLAGNSRRPYHHD